MINLAIVGATGAVGQELIKLLNTRNTFYDNLYLFSSERSKGQVVVVRDQEYIVNTINPYSFEDINYAIFCVSSDLSKEYAKYAKNCVIIDNSSAFRMDDTVPLVIPEINGELIMNNNIIANPNCSTIILLMAIHELHNYNKIKSVHVSTYQAASGAGLEAMRELENQAISYTNKETMNTDVFGRQYLFNAFSHNSDIDKDNLMNQEELKMIHETQKILGDIKIYPTCIRIPTLRSHLESVHIEFENDFSIEQIKMILDDSIGVKLLDDIENNIFPEPLISAEKNDIYVGRIVGDFYGDNKKFSMLISGDQLLKGAALNALQIYEKLI